MTEEYSDLELIQLVKQNDSSAFSELVKRYRGRALGLAYSWVGNRHDAEDIAQEAFIRVYKGVKGFREIADFFTWFYRIVLNLCRDHYRKKKNINLIHLGSYSQEETDAQHIALDKIDANITRSSSNNNPARTVINKELDRKIKQAIARLPEKQRTAFTLKHLEGLTIKEISNIMKCTQGTIKAHLWRAVNRLHSLLESYVNEEE
ncbi:MAG: RNA polymerase sigma factor [Candidatus Omnitrophica bacterium]|nr:RNA polymerase sigma factor [Candidatus Omnitrophota bacterium]